MQLGKKLNRTYIIETIPFLLLDTNGHTFGNIYEVQTHPAHPNLFC